MTTYVCRTDNVDLTALVERAIEDKGGSVADVAPVVEGLDTDLDSARSTASYLTHRWRESRSSGTVVVVTCPKDSTDNVFVVEGLER